MAERCKQGLCFNCDEQYIHGHRCKCLFYIEVEDYDENVSGPMDANPDDTDNTPTVSLHALTRL